MAVPKFENFLYPFMQQLVHKDMSKAEMREALVAYFDLTEEDCSVPTRSGYTTQLNDRLGWSLQWLRRALFVEIPQRGVYRITKRGRDYMSTHSDLRESDLLKYPEFLAYSRPNAINKDEKQQIIDFPSVLNISEQTPTEQLEQAFHAIQNDLAVEILQKTLEASPQFFEQLVVDLMLKMGYGGSSANSGLVTPFVHDDGIDGIISEDKLGLDKIYIQAKRYKPENTIGKPQIQQFAGALDEKKASKGVFITTSSYSKEARLFVEKASKKIVLIDGKELAHYMIEYNVGVSVKRVYEVKRIDSDYFEE
ncbi:MAG: restriction endonuclease [Bacteroidaceae bacterium]|nr:restriction endonuclease [Bacteroidaceae bacterium]